MPNTTENPFAVVRVGDLRYDSSTFTDVDASSRFFLCCDRVAVFQWIPDKLIAMGTAQTIGLPLYKKIDPESRQAIAAFMFRYDHRPGAGSSAGRTERDSVA